MGTYVIGVTMVGSFPPHLLRGMIAMTTPTDIARWKQIYNVAESVYQNYGEVGPR